MRAAGPASTATVFFFIFFFAQTITIIIKLTLQLESVSDTVCMVITSKQERFIKKKEQEGPKLIFRLFIYLFIYLHLFIHGEISSG